MITGRPLTLGGASSAVPGIFGDGSDGDLVIAAGETVELEVISPYLSVVEKNYNSITIESGGTLKCDANNAGLVLRCKGDCTINGTIDQSCKSGVPNPNNNFDYPDEIVCGDGGKGGKVAAYTGEASGGAGMNGHKGGGGWSGGGAGGCYTGSVSSDWQKVGGAGGSVNAITPSTPIDSFFVGGKTANEAGQNGGGGYGAYRSTSVAGNAPGESGGCTSTANNSTAGGGAGNYGGGVLIIYCGGDVTINGTLLCTGGNGGNGGNAPYYSVSHGNGGGGAGGGAIYIVHYGDYVNYGNLDVNAGGAGVTSNSDKPTAGIVGSITVKQYADGMTK